MSDISEADWGRIHARVWTDREFATAFETDPRGALRKYGPEMGIDPEAAFKLPEQPDDVDDETAKGMAEGSLASTAPYCC